LDMTKEYERKLEKHVRSISRGQGRPGPELEGADLSREGDFRTNIRVGVDFSCLSKNNYPIGERSGSGKTL